MKLKSITRWSSASACLLPLVLHAQFTEIDPVDPIPETHTQAFATEWNGAGAMESWTTTQVTLEAGAPVAGIMTGTTTGVDPNITRSGLVIPSSSDTIIEFRLKKQTADTSRIDLFWADDKGGFGGGRTVTITPPAFPADDAFHTVRITFSGQLLGDITAFRLDMSADALGNGKTFSIDYFRVYTTPSVNLSWDATSSAGTALGGTGTWDTTSNKWWNGVANTNWPAVSTGIENANFDGTAGTVTLASGGVTASYLNFKTGGYTITGTDPITLDGKATIRATTGTTTIDAPLASFEPITFLGANALILKKAGTQNISTRLSNSHTGVSHKDAFGTGTVIMGAGGNVFFSTLGSALKFPNPFEFRGNRLVINNSDYTTGLGTFDIEIDSTFLLASVAPGDMYLRKNLTINGVVSGTGAAGRSFYFSGDANTLTLKNTANDFTGTIRWDNSTILAAQSDGSMGSSTNALSFNAGAGSVKALSAFTSARNVSISGSTTAKIDTNGFDITWGGTFTGTTSGTTVHTTLMKTGAGKLTLNGVGSTLQGGIRADAGILEIAGGTITCSQWNSAFGVSPAAELRVTGGNLTTSYLGIGYGGGLVEGLMTVDGGTYTNGLELLVGFGASGRFVMKSGSADLNQLSFGDGVDATRQATIELNGGTTSLNRTNRRGGSGTATILMNGGTLRAKSDQADFLRGTLSNTQYLVKAGGAIFDTNNKSITSLLPLQHDSALGATVDGGLTKNGAGTLTLSVANTYTGPTKVNAGTLSLAAASLDDAADVEIASGATLNLTSGVTDTVDELIYNGAAQSPGVYGSLASTAQYKVPFITGTGTLTVTNGPASPYNTWATAAGYWTVGAPMSGPGDDFDGDGVKNLAEFAFGGDPTDGGDTGPRYSATTGDHLVLTIAVRVGAAASFAASGAPLTSSIDGVNYIIRGSKDLLAFAEPVEKLATVSLGNLPVSATDGYEYVSFQLQNSVTSQAKGFLQAVAEQ